MKWVWNVHLWSYWHISQGPRGQLWIEQYLIIQLSGGYIGFYTPQTTVGGYIGFYTPPNNCWGVYWFHSVRPSVRPSRLSCPLCNIYSSGWILSILATNDHYHERVCRTQWPLTLTYIFKVIGPWLRKLCPLCSVYSSGWILFIFGTNDHYH